jgi:hypothetical protein
MSLRPRAPMQRVCRVSLVKAWKDFHPLPGAFGLGRSGHGCLNGG